MTSNTSLGTCFYGSYIGNARRHCHIGYLCSDSLGLQSLETVRSSHGRLERAWSVHAQWATLSQTRLGKQWPRGESRLPRLVPQGY